MKIWRIVAVLIVAVVVGIGIYAAADVTADGIVAVTLKKDLTTYEVKAAFTSEFVTEYKGQTLYLFKFAPGEGATDITKLEPVATSKVAANVVFKAAYNAGGIAGEDGTINKSVLYSRFAVAVKNGESYELVTTSRYFDNYTAAAENVYEFPERISGGMLLKKGLDVRLYADAQELGISHTKLTVALNEFLTENPATESVTYVWNDRTYSVSSYQLSLLDTRIKLLTDSGVNVALEIVLTQPSESQSEELDVLYAADSYDSATMCAFNTSDKTAVGYIAGFLDFIAARYTDPEGTYGFAGSFIIGRNVNSNRTWYSMGGMPLDNFVNSYAAMVRIADTALRSNYANGRVYVSVANNFNALSPDLSVQTDPSLDYSVKDFLTKFAERITAGGGLPWRLAICASPSDPTNSDILSDESATDSADTPFVTMKNLEVLCSWLGGETFLYNGQSRTILVSDFEVAGHNYAADSQDNVVTTAPSTTDDTTQLQAASYAYAYYKAATLDTVEALIYSSHTDTATQIGAEYTGLWTINSDELGSPKEKKPIYNVFRYIDTSRSSEMTASSLSKLGVTSWESLFEGFSLDKIALRELYEMIPVLASDISKSLNVEPMYDFSASSGGKSSLCGFLPTDNTSSIQLRVDGGEAEELSKLYAIMATKYPTERMGIGVTGTSEAFANTVGVKNSVHTIPMKNVQYLSFEVKIEAPEDVASVEVLLRLTSNGTLEVKKGVTGGESGVIYEGVTQVKPNEWQTVTFKTDMIGNSHDGVDCLKIMIKPYDGLLHDGTYGMWLGGVNAYIKSVFPIGSVLAAFGIVVLIVVALFAGYVAFVQIRYRKKLRKREEMRRRQQMQRKLSQTGQYPKQRPQAPNGGQARSSGQIPPKRPVHKPPTQGPTQSPPDN